MTLRPAEIIIEQHTVCRNPQRGRKAIRRLGQPYLWADVAERLWADDGDAGEPLGGDAIERRTSTGEDLVGLSDLLVPATLIEKTKRQRGPGRSSRAVRFPRRAKVFGYCLSVR